MTSLCPSSPGFQLNSSRLFQSEYKALSASFSLPAIPRAVRVFHTACARKPLQPTSTVNSQACHPLSLHYWTRSWYLVAFLFEASSYPCSRGTVSSIMIILFTSSDHITTSGLSDELEGWGWIHVSIKLFLSLLLQDVSQCSEDLVMTPSVYPLTKCSLAPHQYVCQRASP